MSASIQFAALLVVSATLFSVIVAWPRSVLKEFEAYKIEFNLTFECTADENLAIYNFIVNKRRIDEYNKKPSNLRSFDVGIWEKSYETDQKLNKELNGLWLPSNSETTSEDDYEESPVKGRAIFIAGYEIAPPPPNVTSFDWLKLGAVVPGIRSQGSCGCCYALASTGAVEGQAFRKFNNLLKLSDQQIIDCSQSYGNRGCGTGSMENSFKYIKSEGIAAGVDYKFRAKESGACSYSKAMKKMKLFDYRRIRVKTDELLRDLVYTIGPIAIAVNGSLFSFLNYKSGIYNDPQCVGDVNHAMLLVGFGRDPIHGDYWIVKNSYGATWGEKGYIRISRKTENVCSIRNYVVLPIL